ncbi:hypothetical protein J8273_6956 [Carpediemonas membranifera]|uniref:Uncharacterized protein n=1 Tax=Carpediemonas membranifera TaxID=201153 RepID=A0A8J6DZP8_9EUKA|nr:hypothetical protein J8273_6956 [Carpediemonas membranifera]|eukprot:KAG9390716.1 hypothetical protein J8273_6956 [Carpediemonas membranifera]
MEHDIDFFLPSECNEIFQSDYEAAMNANVPTRLMIQLQQALDQLKDDAMTDTPLIEDIRQRISKFPSANSIVPVVILLASCRRSFTSAKAKLLSFAIGTLQGNPSRDTHVMVHIIHTILALAARSQTCPDADLSSLCDTISGHILPRDGNLLQLVHPVIISVMDATTQAQAAAACACLSGLLGSVQTHPRHVLTEAFTQALALTVDGPMNSTLRVSLRQRLLSAPPSSLVLLPDTAGVLLEDHLVAVTQGRSGPCRTACLTLPGLVSVISRGELPYVAQSVWGWVKYLSGPGKASIGTSGSVRKTAVDSLGRLWEWAKGEGAVDGPLDPLQTGNGRWNTPGWSASIDDMGDMTDTGEDMTLMTPDNMRTFRNSSSQSHIVHADTIGVGTDTGPNTPTLKDAASQGSGTAVGTGVEATTVPSESVSVDAAVDVAETGAGVGHGVGAGEDESLDAVGPSAESVGTGAAPAEGQSDHLEQLAEIPIAAETVEQTQSSPGGPVQKPCADSPAPTAAPTRPEEDKAVLTAVLSPIIEEAGMSSGWEDESAVELEEGDSTGVPLAISPLKLSSSNLAAGQTVESGVEEELEEFDDIDDVEEAEAEAVTLTPAGMTSTRDSTHPGLGSHGQYRVEDDVSEAEDSVNHGWGRATVDRREEAVDASRRRASTRRSALSQQTERFDPDAGPAPLTQSHAPAMAPSYAPVTQPRSQNQSGNKQSQSGTGMPSVMSKSGVMTADDLYTDTGARKMTRKVPDFEGALGLSSIQVPAEMSRVDEDFVRTHVSESLSAIDQVVSDLAQADPDSLEKIDYHAALGRVRFQHKTNLDALAKETMLQLEDLRQSFMKQVMDLQKTARHSISRAAAASAVPVATRTEATATDSPATQASGVDPRHDLGDSRLISLSHGPSMITAGPTTGSTLLSRARSPGLARRSSMIGQSPSVLYAQRMSSLETKLAQFKRRHRGLDRFS